MHNPFRFLLFLLLLLPGVTLAQDDTDDCTAEVEDALAQVDTVCTGLGRNLICYGHSLIEVELGDTADMAPFRSPGDVLGVDEIASLSTAPFDPETGDWGVALIALQANLPDTTPGQLVRFVLFGDTTIEPGPQRGDYSAPMQAFQLRTGIGEVSCRGLPPDGLLVQVPTGETVDLSVNGLAVRVGSTAFFRTPTAQTLEVGTLDGRVEIETAGGPLVIEAGFSSVVALEAASGGDAPEADFYENDDIWNLPTGLLPEPVAAPRVVPGSADWTATNITLQGGDEVIVSAAGSVDIWPGCPTDCGAPTDCAALCPVVLGIGPEGSVPIDGIVPESAPHILVPGAPLGVLVGRVGEGEPFVIGRESAFVADAAGELFLSVNEDLRFRGDETGGYIVSIGVIGAAADDE